jgi:phosphoglycolate phosphatase-like HAD superfamily hydrolase
MVGDAPTDMLAGRAAGVAGCVGVTTGVSRRADLEPFADVVLESLQALEVAPEPGTTGA